MRLNALAVTAGFAVMFASAYPAVNGEAVAEMKQIISAARD
jgi:hypothetical protein